MLNNKNWEEVLQSFLKRWPTHTNLWWSRRPCSRAVPGVSQAGWTRPRLHTAPRGGAAARGLGLDLGPGLGLGAGRGPGRPAWLTSHCWRETGAMGLWSWSSTGLSGPDDREQTAGARHLRRGEKEGWSKGECWWNLRVHSDQCVSLFPYRVFNFKCCCWLCSVLPASQLHKSVPVHCRRHFSSVGKWIRRQVGVKSNSC